jgi:hypothetical protein
MPRRLGPGLLLAAAVGGAFTQAASAQGPSRFDGDYVGKLTLTALIQGNCTEPPWGALYPLNVSGGQVRFSYVPRFDTTLVGRVAENGSFRASAPTKMGPVEMTGQISGNTVNAQIVSPSCRYTFQTGY